MNTYPQALQDMFELGFTLRPLKSNVSIYESIRDRFIEFLDEPRFAQSFPWTHGPRGSDIPTYGFKERNGERGDHKYFLHVTPELIQDTFMHQNSIPSNYKGLIRDCAEVQAKSNQAISQFIKESGLNASVLSGRSTFRLLAYKNVGAGNVSATGHFDKGLLTSQLYSTAPGLRIIQPGSAEPTDETMQFIDFDYSKYTAIFPGLQAENQLGLPMAWHDVKQTQSTADGIWRFSIVNFYEPHPHTRVELSTKDYVPSKATIDKLVQ